MKQNFKDLALAILISLAIAMPFYAFRSHDAGFTRYYTAAGLVRRDMKVWTDQITPSSATHTVDISSAGFTTVSSVEVSASNNTATVNSMPLAVVKSFTATEVVVNILEANSQFVVLGGTTTEPLVFAPSLTGISVHIKVTGF